MLVDVNLIHVRPTAGWREDAEESIPPAQGQLPSPSQCFACAGEAGAASAAPHHPQPRCGRGHGRAGSPLLGHGTGSLMGHEAALPYPCCTFQTARPFFHCPWDGTEQKAGEKCKMGVGVCTGVSFYCGIGCSKPGGEHGTQASQPMGTQSIIPDYPN